MFMNPKRLAFLLAISALCCSASFRPALADEDAWKQAMRQGSEAFQQSNYGQAEKYFRMALKEAQVFGLRDVRTAQTLTNLGVLYKSHGQIAKAQPYFEKAVYVQEQALGSNNFEVISNKAKLCQFYLSVGERAKADQLASCVITYAQQHSKDTRQMSQSFKSLRDYYQNRPDLEDAEIMVRQAEDMTQKKGANHTIDLAVLLDNLAGAYGTKPQAEPMYKMALEIREALLPPTHMALAHSSENLAKLYVAEGKLTEAEPLFRRALEISRKTMGDRKGETLSCLDAYAQCCEKLGKNREAEELYREALQPSTDKRSGNGGGGLCQIQLGLANLLNKEGRFQEAAPYFAQALKSEENLRGPDHASLGPILDAYADVLDKTNRHAEANKLHNRAKAIRGWM